MTTTTATTTRTPALFWFKSSTNSDACLQLGQARTRRRETEKNGRVEAGRAQEKLNTGKGKEAQSRSHEARETGRKQHARAHHGAGRDKDVRQRQARGHHGTGQDKEVREQVRTQAANGLEVAQDGKVSHAPCFFVLPTWGLSPVARNHRNGQWTGNGTASDILRL